MTGEIRDAIPDTSLEAARASHLRWVSDAGPGIRRLRRGRGFRYVDETGACVRDEETLARIRTLAVPPAWRDVWICKLGHGHIQASGRDAKGRKQYRYRERWRAVRDSDKFDRMLAFARALPRIRERVEKDLALPGLPREKVLATVVRLLEVTRARVGNKEYAKTNKSFGLTTLKENHVAIDGPVLRFHFRGKSGKMLDVDVKDERLARVVRRCQELPGDELFRYEDDAGELRPIDSADVNAYLREIAGEEFSAKDFRTWSGTVLALEALERAGPFRSKVQAKRNVVRAIESVARQLNNTPTIARKSYVHPAVIDAYLGGLLARAKDARRGAAALRGLDARERAALALLARRPTPAGARAAARVARSGRRAA